MSESLPWDMMRRYVGARGAAAQTQIVDWSRRDPAFHSWVTGSLLLHLLDELRGLRRQQGREASEQFDILHALADAWDAPAAPDEGPEAGQVHVSDEAERAAALAAAVAMTEAP